MHKPGGLRNCDIYEMYSGVVGLHQRGFKLVMNLHTNVYTTKTQSVTPCSHNRYITVFSQPLQLCSVPTKGVAERAEAIHMLHSVQEMREHSGGVVSSTLYHTLALLHCVLGEADQVQACLHLCVCVCV